MWCNGAIKILLLTLLKTLIILWDCDQQIRFNPQFGPDSWLTSELFPFRCSSLTFTETFLQAEAVIRWPGRSGSSVVSVWRWLVSSCSSSCSSSPLSTVEPDWSSSPDRGRQPWSRGRKEKSQSTSGTTRPSVWMSTTSSPASIWTTTNRQLWPSISFLSEDPWVKSFTHKNWSFSYIL